MLRFRPWWRGSAISLLVIIAAAGFAGNVVLVDQPAGRSTGPPAGGVELPQAAASGLQEMASSLPRPTPAARDSVQPAAPADPVSSVAPPSPAPPRPESATPPSVASSPARPDLHPRIASSAPLEASPPIRVDIAAVGVTAPIGPLGLNRDGTLEVPTNFARAGWYTGRPTPGEAGPAIIVAHRSSRRGPGAFWKLPDVQPGQQIVVTRADRKRVLFSVERVEQHRKDAFPTAAVYGPTPDTALRLITCGGPVRTRPRGPLPRQRHRLRPHDRLGLITRTGRRRRQGLVVSEGDHVLAVVPRLAVE